MAFPRVEATFDYKRPLRLEDEFDVLIQIVSIRNKTIAYSCVLTLNGEVAAVGRMTIACVRTVPGQSRRAIPLPAHIVERSTWHRQSISRRRAIKQRVRGRSP